MLTYPHVKPQGIEAVIDLTCCTDWMLIYKGFTPTVFDAYLILHLQMSLHVTKAIQHTPHVQNYFYFVKKGTNDQIGLQTGQTGQQPQVQCKSARVKQLLHRSGSCGLVFLSKQPMCLSFILTLGLPLLVSYSQTVISLVSKHSSKYIRFFIDLFILIVTVPNRGTNFQLQTDKHVGLQWKCVWWSLMVMKDYVSLCNSVVHRSVFSRFWTTVESEHIFNCVCDT